MRLSDFKDEQGVEVVAKLLVPVCKIAANPNNEEAKKKAKNKLEFASAMLQNNPAEIKEMLAIMNGVEPEEYHCNGATVMIGLLEMLADDEVMLLFGLQGKKTGPTCSGAPSETTEAPEQ